MLGKFWSRIASPWIDDGGQVIIIDRSGTSVRSPGSLAAPESGGGGKIAMTIAAGFIAGGVLAWVAAQSVG
jgi:hypothetical protein